MAAPAAVRYYEIFKKPMSDYTVKPKHYSSQEYAVKIESESSADSPFMFLHEGSSAKDAKTIVGAVRRNLDNDGFEISSDGSQNFDNTDSLAAMRRTLALTAEIHTSLPDGKPHGLTWRPNLGHGDFSCNLVDTTDPMKNLAKFEYDSFLKRGGTLKLNVDWGADFDRLVVMSCISMFERTSAWAKQRFSGRGVYDNSWSAGTGMIVGFSGGFAGAAGE